MIKPLYSEFQNGTENTTPTNPNIKIVAIRAKRIRVKALNTPQKVFSKINLLILFNMVANKLIRFSMK